MIGFVRLFQVLFARLSCVIGVSFYVCSFERRAARMVGEIRRTNFQNTQVTQATNIKLSLEKRQDGTELQDTDGEVRRRGDIWFI